MKFLKKNQVVIYVIALMLVVAGYLNFSTNGDFKTAVQTASSEEELEKMANIGDAQLVSSNVVSEENSTENVINNKVSTNAENTVVQETDNKVENNTKEDNKTVETSSDTQQKDNDKNDLIIPDKVIGSFRCPHRNNITDHPVIHPKRGIGNIIKGLSPGRKAEFTNSLFSSRKICLNVLDCSCPDLTIIKIIKYIAGKYLLFLL